MNRAKPDDGPSDPVEGKKPATVWEEGRQDTSPARGIFSFLGWTLLFGIAYTQPHLYYSNQNQYFLHGLARAGQGFLQEDWLAHTADPTPVFSTLVALTSRYLHESLFYLYSFLLLGIYFQALLGIFEHLSGGKATPRTRLVFMAVFVLLHGALLRWASAQLCGVDYPWYFQAGVANQYVLGAGLQPSMFGVLLLLSIASFLSGSPGLAVTWSSLAAVVHATYLLPAAFLTLAYQFLLVREKQLRTAFLVGCWALLLVLPVVIYNLRTFGPSAPETFAQAQHLLAHVRIPHHALLDRWLDGIAWAQIGWVVLGLVLVRGTRLLVILLLPSLLALMLTLVQQATGNDTLALLFPWRVSAIMVPLATAIVLTRSIQRVSLWLPQVARRWESVVPSACIASLLVAAVGGAMITYLDLGYRTNTQEVPLLEHIRTRKQEGEVYLLPVELPKLSSGKKGAASLNFTSPPRRSTQQQTISVDLQQFRLFTGAPIYIDFKSIPYKDVDVLEWHQRLLWNDRLYQQRDWKDDQIRRMLRDRGITHVVATADRALRADFLQLIYADAYYRLYRVRGHLETTPP